MDAMPCPREGAEDFLMNADPKKAEQSDDVDGIEGEHDVSDLMEVHDFPPTRFEA